MHIACFSLFVQLFLIESSISDSLRRQSWTRLLDEVLIDRSICAIALKCDNYLELHMYYASGTRDKAAMHQD